MPIHPSIFGSVPVVTWINAGERHIRVFQLVVDAKDWVARLHSMDHISEVEILNALVHVPEAETAGSR